MRSTVKWLSGFYGTASAVAAGAILLVALTWALVLERARYEERDAVNRARAHSAALALAFEQQIARTLQAIDQAVLFARHAYDGDGVRLDLRRLFAQSLDSREFLYGGVVDAGGVVILATGKQAGADVSDREYFAHHRDRSADLLRVGTPTAERVTGQHSIQFTRRISGPKGEFRGVVVLGMSPGVLADYSRHIDVGPKGQVLLVGLDGVSRARRIGDSVTAGDDARATTLLARAAKEASGSFVSAGRYDGVKRYMSYHVLPQHALVAAIGLGVDDALAPARERARTYYAAAAVGSVLTALAAGLLLAALWRRNQAIAERQRAGARHQADLTRFRATLDASSDAIYIVARRTMTIVDANDAACRALGRPRKDLIGAAPNRVYAGSSVSRADVERIYDRLIAGPRRSENVERTHRRKDGTAFPVEIQRSAVEVDGEWYVVAVARDITQRKLAENTILEKNARLAKQQLALSGVAKSDLLQGCELDDAIRRLTEVAADTLGVGRVSYWRLQEAGAGIECVDLFEGAARRHRAGAGFAASDYPNYFAALGRHDLIAASDAHTDPRTAEFSAGYLTPLGIGAMLDVPVFVGGRPAGVLCHEHVGGPRPWHGDEQLFASAIGGLVSLAVERAERQREERLVRMEHGITRCLAEAESLSAGLQCTLASLCQAQGWEAARYYAHDEEADLLRFVEAWTIADARYDDFNHASRGISFQRGEGLGGLVWQSGEALWVPDVTKDARVVNPALARSGIRSAFVFPVASGAKIIGIVASFSREVRAPDERLLRATRAIGAQIGQLVERKRAQERADHLAQFDTVTELPNRSLFYDRLAQTLNQAHRHAWNVGVLFCDVDFFKKVNDTLGHAAGDRLLQQIAKRLAMCVRAGDTVARIGGDEFAVIAADLANPQDAARVAAKIVEALREPFTLDGQDVFATGSVGIATYPLDGKDGVALMKNADAAMSRAKELGRNNYQFYAAAMNERALEKLQMQNDLRRALERGEFRLHFQPKADLADGRLTGFEALLRWERPGKGLVSPAQFVPLLEETGLIVPVGGWVIGAACAQIAAWQRAGGRALPVSVNLAAKQLAQSDLVAVIEAALHRHAVEAQLLEVEVTESDAMHNPEQCMETLRRIRALGVAVSIDDFGTGYSSLSYLKRMPVVALKLDRSFVKDLPANAEDASITQAVITLAHSLGLKVVAEGVETPQQRDFLAAHGCDQMQGYLLSRPLPAAQCAALLERATESAAAA